MKIGLVTWFGTGNFGTDLQAYALSKYLTNHGHQVYIYQIFNHNDLGLMYSIKRRLGIFKRFIMRLAEGASVRNKRYFATSKYVKEYLNVYPLVTTRHQYEKILQNTDLFLTGSDQIWNPYHLFPFYLLPFAKGKRCSAYASSVGVSSIPSERIDIYRQELMKFSYIGVRERSGTNELKRITGRKDIETVLDPTFLLRADEWLSFASKSNLKKKKIPADYMLVYVIGGRQQYKNIINQIAFQYGINNIVVANSVEGVYLDSVTLALDVLSPMDFIYLLANARLVLTDSFHATALSINLNVNFIDLFRFAQDNSISQNSRIIDMLTDYNLSDRIYRENGVFPDEKIDYVSVNNILENKRLSSYSFLNQILNND